MDCEKACEQASSYSEKHAVGLERESVHSWKVDSSCLEAVSDVQRRSVKTMAYGRIWTSRDDFRLDWRPGVEAGSQRRGEAGQGQGERSRGHAMHKGQEGLLSSAKSAREVEKEKSKGEAPGGSLSDVWTLVLAGGGHRGRRSRWQAGRETL